MLRIRLLGGLSVDAPHGRVGGAAAQPRRLALLARLAHAGARGVTREHLLALLWPDLDDDRGRAVLRNALYALRRDLGSEDAITGLQELRLNPDLVTCDLGDFQDALSRGELERAVDAYGGPFLEGFRLPNAPEFERWADTERMALAHRYRDVLESLARNAVRAGDTGAATRWWRRAADDDPLNANYALGLMQALVAAGNRAGALQHARIYETLVGAELGLRPDRAVVAFVKRIREEAEPPSAEPVAAPEVDLASVSESESVQTAASPIEPETEGAVHAGRPAARRAPLRVLVLLAIGLSVGLGMVLGYARLRAARARPEPVIVVGPIVDHRPGATGAGLGIAADLLATSLARVPDVRVVSSARTYELLAHMGADIDAASSADVSAAARRAGAGELIDGSIYMLPDGQLRLDVRRTALGTGDLLASHTLVGSDLFTLVDSATLRLAPGSGGSRPAASIADVTTASEAAHALYQEGLRRHFRGNTAGAHSLFVAALREDSTFAMAEYYAAISSGPFDSPGSVDRLARAVALSERASERERLIIRAGWARRTNDPSLMAIAETLTVRYPDEVDGHLMVGLAAFEAGDRARAMPALARVVAMDSLALAGVRAPCAACEALAFMVYGLFSVDSLDAAIREAQRWTRLQPESAHAWASLYGALAALDRYADARAAIREAARLDPTFDASPAITAELWIRQGLPDSAEAQLRALRGSVIPERRYESLWYLAIALREQGRHEEAIEAIRASRSTIRDLPTEPSSVDPLHHAQILIEAGRPREALAILDSLAQRPVDEPLPLQARQRSWVATHVATAVAALGDTVRLRAVIDTLAVVGPQSRLARDRLLHHYARGLLFDARGDLESAADAYRSSLVSTTTGYTRASYRLALVLVRLGRPTEAIGVLQPALRGSIEASNLYVTRTELREALARAWEQAGRPDSAAHHYGVVAHAWRNADPLLRERADLAAQRSRTDGRN